MKSSCLSLPSVGIIGMHCSIGLWNENIPICWLRVLLPMPKSPGWQSWLGVLCAQRHLSEMGTPVLWEWEEQGEGFLCCPTSNCLEKHRLLPPHPQQRPCSGGLRHSLWIWGCQCRRLSMGMSPGRLWVGRCWRGLQAKNPRAELQEGKGISVQTGTGMVQFLMLSVAQGPSG